MNALQRLALYWGSRLSFSGDPVRMAKAETVVGELGFLKSLMRREPVFIESGTYTGCLSGYVADHTKSLVVTIESDPWLFRMARRRFSSDRSVVSLFGKAEAVVGPASMMAFGMCEHPLVYLDAQTSDGSVRFLHKQLTDVMSTSRGCPVVIVDDFHDPNVKTEVLSFIEKMGPYWNCEWTFHVTEIPVSDGVSLGRVEFEKTFSRRVILT